MTTTANAEMFEDARDAEIARARLEEIRNNPNLLIEGDELRKRLNELHYSPCCVVARMVPDDTC